MAEARTFIDISVPLEAGLPSDPPMMLPKIEYFDHDQTVGQIQSFSPGCRWAICRMAKGGPWKHFTSAATMALTWMHLLLMQGACYSVGYETATAAIGAPAANSHFVRISPVRAWRNESQ